MQHLAQARQLRVRVAALLAPCQIGSSTAITMAGDSIKAMAAAMCPPKAIAWLSRYCSGGDEGDRADRAIGGRHGRRIKSDNSRRSTR